MKARDTEFEADRRQPVALSDLTFLSTRQCAATTRQGDMQATIDQSSRMVAQRRLLKSLSGGAPEPANRDLDGGESRTQVERPPVERMNVTPGSGEPNAGLKHSSGAGTNVTCIPSLLNDGIEALSSLNMSDARTHRDSDKPVQLNARASAPGSDDHLGMMASASSSQWAGVERNDIEADRLSQRQFGSSSVVQRLINVPFATRDNKLEQFANEHATGLADPPVILGPTRAQVGIDESIAIIAHGNGASICGVDGAAGFLPHELAAYLQEMLPVSYSGVITIWACQSARPYGNMKQPVADREVINESYITVLDAWLRSKQELDFNGTIRGSIGFVTLDRKFNVASIFEDEHDLLFGKHLKYPEGFIRAGERAPDGFYPTADGQDASEEDGESEYDEDEADGMDFSDDEEIVESAEEASEEDVSSSNDSERDSLADSMSDVEDVKIPEVLSVHWLNLVSDLGARQAGTRPEYFQGTFVIDRTEGRDGNWVKVRVIGADNSTFRGLEGWSKLSWLVKAMIQ